MKDALREQVGGDHYKKYAIQPIQYACEMWGAPAIAFNVTRYLVRYKDKNGIEDLRKALHCCELAVQVMGTWTGVHNLNPRQQAVFNTYIDVNGMDGLRLVLLKAAQFDFVGCKRDIERMIEEEGGEI